MVALAHSSKLSIGRSVMVTVLLVIVALCLTTPTRGAATSGTDQPFDLALWESHFRDGRKYYACRPPRCQASTLVSFSVERIEGDEAQALAREQETQRRIAARVAGRELLSFDLLSTQNAPGLRAAWRDVPSTAGKAPTFGALRIVIVSGTRVLVLATSDDEATAQRSELALSRWLGLAP